MLMVNESSYVLRKVVARVGTDLSTCNTRSTKELSMKVGGAEQTSGFWAKTIYPIVA